MMVHFVDIDHQNMLEVQPSRSDAYCGRSVQISFARTASCMGVTYVTLLPSFARGHFAVHLMAHFEGIDH